MKNAFDSVILELIEWTPRLPIWRWCMLLSSCNLDVFFSASSSTKSVKLNVNIICWNQNLCATNVQVKIEKTQLNLHSAIFWKSAHQLLRSIFRDFDDQVTTKNSFDLHLFRLQSRERPTERQIQRARDRSWARDPAREESSESLLSARLPAKQNKKTIGSCCRRCRRYHHCQSASELEKVQMRKSRSSS